MTLKKTSKKQNRNPLRKSKSKKKIYGGTIKDVNYISNILMGLSDRLYTDPLVRNNINKMTKNVRHVWDSVFFQKKGRFKKYTDEIEYTLTDASDFTIQKNGDVPFVPIFLKKQKIIGSIHKVKTAKIHINHKIVEVNFYYDQNLEENNLKKNIDMIITRLYNLCILFEDKKKEYETWPDEEDADEPTIIKGGIFNFTHHIYLYNNPRRVRLTGNNDTLSQMYESEEACFNIPGGMTSDPDEGFWTVNSKLEDILGLFTHEILHAVRFSPPTGAPKKNLPKVFQILGHKQITWGRWLGEYVINAHASIIHSYLIHYEMMNISLNDALKYELIYQFIQTLRLGKIQGTPLQTILMTDTPLLFKQETPLFEYIYVRTLILFYYNEMNEGLKSCLTDMNNGILDIFNEPCNFTDFLVNILDRQSHSELILLLNSIQEFLEDYTNKRLPERDDVCGKAIMNYFCIDPIIIDKAKQLPALYGGRIYNLKT
jgi:hypothetical protein